MKIYFDDCESLGKSLKTLRSTKDKAIGKYTKIWEKFIGRARSQISSGIYYLYDTCYIIFPRGFDDLTKKRESKRAYFSEAQNDLRSLGEEVADADLSAFIELIQSSQ